MSEFKEYFYISKQDNIIEMYQIKVNDIMAIIVNEYKPAEFLSFFCTNLSDNKTIIEKFTDLETIAFKRHTVLPDNQKYYKYLRKIEDRGELIEEKFIIEFIHKLIERSKYNEVHKYDYLDEIEVQAETSLSSEEEQEKLLSQIGID